MDVNSIGLRIKYARNKKGFTQEELADMIHVTRHHISMIEAGARGISLDVLIDVSNALQVPVSELLSDNLSSSENSSTTVLSRVLLDCTEQEERIIIKAASALKAILHEFGV